MTETRDPERDVGPQHIFTLLGAYQQTAALRGAIELDLFSAISAGAGSVGRLASRCRAAERGIRILCDTLVVLGLLTRTDERYALTPDSAKFLDRASPACVTDVVRFLMSETITGSFRDIAETVRRGGTIMDAGGTLAPDHPVWVDFAASMVPMMRPPAEAVASLLERSLRGEPAPRSILDVAAGHGIFGIAMALRFPQAELVALDWTDVVDVARRNAERAGIADRFRAVAGSAFDADLGSGHDLVLLPNFLHHFSRGECVELLARLHATMAPGGRVVIVEFIPDEDRISPRDSALFALVMLATTPAGDAYTWSEYESMLSECGFGSHQRHGLGPLPHRVIVSRKKAPTSARAER